MQLSVIIPCYNEQANIGGTLDALSIDKHPVEVIVVDGGSSDRTAAIVGTYKDVSFIQSEIAGRAHQMNLGADHASGDVFLFLHADTKLPEGYYDRISEILAHEAHCGGSFRLAFDADHWMLRVVEYFTYFNLKWFTFGDHGMFFRAHTFKALGGYKKMAVLEDLELQLRARRLGKMPRIALPVTTSARRFTKNGVFRQIAADALILLGYAFGMSDEKLAKWYPRHS